MKNSLNRNLFIGFGVSLLILIASSTASFVSIQGLLKNAEEVQHTNKVINGVHEILAAMIDAETGQRGFLLTGNDIFLEPYTGAFERASDNVERVRDLTIDNPTQQKNINGISDLVLKRFSMLRKLIDTKKVGDTISTPVLMAGKSYMDSIRRFVRNMELEEQNLLKERTESMNRFSSYTPILIIVGAVLALMITIIFYLKVKRDIADKMALQKALEDKDKEITTRIGVIRNIAGQVSDGNYSVRVQDSEKDNLGELSVSLNRMAESLQFSFSQLSEKEWLQTGIAGLNQTILDENLMTALTQKILSFTAEYTNSLSGAFYLMGPDKVLTLQTGYALQSSQVKEKLQIGEGLPGQCAISKKEILITDIKEKDIHINFTTASLSPVCVMIFPVLFENQVKGVIEIASINTYTTKEITFFKSISENIGIAINTVQNRQRLQELLEETQSQSEELMAQHAELEHINAELEAQAEELQTSEEELKVQQEELLETNSMLEERSTLLEDRNIIIQQKNIEIQKKAEDLAISTRYKSEFLANMSHELRTPLNSILLLSRLMADNNEANLTPEQVQYAEVIQSSGNGLLELIDEILDLSKIEAGKMSVEFSMTSIESITRDLQVLFEPLAKQKKVAWNIVIDDEAPGQLETDKLRLDQILKNLLSNAFKFTSAGSVKLVIDMVAEQPTMVRFQVTDTGIGIAPEKQQMVFEAFQQEDGSTRRKYGGTGLGLSISKELCRLLGGELSLTSVPGQGSTFTLILPITRKLNINVMDISSPEDLALLEEPMLESPQLQEIPRYKIDIIPNEIADDRNNITEIDNIILIIEDDTAFAKALLDYARQKNYKGIVAVRGDKGIEMARSYEVKAILLDIELPVKSGWEVMEELKKDPKTRPIPVHIMSSHQLKKESLIKGAVDFINKPVAFEHLNNIFEKIEFILGKKDNKVLIVEDNNKHAQALAYFLGTNAVNTEIYQTLDESIKSLEKKEVDCVILDMGVPDAKAYELLETVKQNGGLKDIPIIIFTGKSLSHAEEFKIKKYADSIVLKTAHSYQRILDEVSLFLHLVEQKKSLKERVDSSGKSTIIDNVLKNKTVLLADDDVRNIFSMTKALEKQQMKVIPAMDGKEALDLLSTTQLADIILMDMMMPEMDGYDTIKAIRKNPLTKNIPIIAVTAKAMTGDREKCIAAGASDYISKPVDVDQLVSLLRIWLYDKGY